MPTEITQALDWLNLHSTPLASLGAVIVFAWRAWIFLHDYHLKVRAEIRLKDTATAEMQVKLLTVFTELMSIAHGRRSYHASEKVIEFLLAKGGISFSTPDDRKRSEEVLSLSAIVLPVGLAAQHAAAVAIATLGQRHDFLHEPSARALSSLDFLGRDVIEECRRILRQPAETGRKLDRK